MEASNNQNAVEDGKNQQSRLRAIVYVDAVNFTQELDTYGKARIDPKLQELQRFVDFFFVSKLKGEMIGQMGDGFLVLCPPSPAELIAEAINCRSFIAAYNHGKEPPATLNTRIAIHIGLVAPPVNGNYVDPPLNHTARLEGATPPNCICLSSALYNVVADTLKHRMAFEELQAEFKGLGQHKFYSVSPTGEQPSQPSRKESRLSYYLTAQNRFYDHEDWEGSKATCEQALLDFPNNPYFTSQLALAHLWLDDCTSAIREYEKCINMGYDLADSYLFMGHTYADMDQLDQAMEMYKRSYESDPNSHHALHSIAETHFKRREYNDSVKWANRSLKKAPGYISPVALLIVISLIKNENASLVPLIRRIDEPRHSYLRQFLAGYLVEARLKGVKSKLEVAFREARTKEDDHQAKRRTQGPKKRKGKGRSQSAR